MNRTIGFALSYPGFRDRQRNSSREQHRSTLDSKPPPPGPGGCGCVMRTLSASDADSPLTATSKNNNYYYIFRLGWGVPSR